MTLRLLSFLIFSLVSDWIEILFPPFCGVKPKLLSVLTHLAKEC